MIYEYIYDYYYVIFCLSNTGSCWFIHSYNNPIQHSSIPYTIQSSTNSKTNGVQKQRKMNNNLKLKSTIKNQLFSISSQLIY